MVFNKSGTDMIFEKEWNEYLKINPTVIANNVAGDIAIQGVKEIAQELFDVGQKSVYDSTMEFFGIVKGGTTRASLVDWLHDKLGIN